jgi:hypothetical protein
MKRKTKRLLIEFCSVMTILVVLSIFMIPRFLDAQNINTPRRIPDPVFRAYLEDILQIEPGGHISKVKASEMQKLSLEGMSRKLVLTEDIYVQGISNGKIYITEKKQSGNQTKQVVAVKAKISDLTGLKYFSNLKELDCNKNEIITLDISNNPNLVRLNCRKNNLSTLDVSNNLCLEFLDLSYNKLTEMPDLRNHVKLEALSVEFNNLSDDDLPRISVLKDRFQGMWSIMGDKVRKGFFYEDQNNYDFAHHLKRTE